MTSNDRATRLLQTWLETEAPLQVPDGLATRIHTATRAERPRPGWLARLEGHHMNVIEGGRRSTAIPRLGLILALVGLLAAGLVAYYVGSRPTTPIVIQPSSATSAAPSPAPPATAVVPTVRPTTPSPTDQPGQPLPDELLGIWFEDTSPYEESYPPRFVYVLPPGDPWCVAQGIRQSCVRSIEPPSTDPGDYFDVWTLVDGNIRTMPFGAGANCLGEPSTMAYVLENDRVTFSLKVPSCYGTVFPMVRVGSEGTPASAPPLP
jgi:hypothetical protein